MPLLPGSDRKVIGKNIAELRSSGHKPKQAIAIALREAGKVKVASEPSLFGHACALAAVSDALGKTANFGAGLASLAGPSMAAAHPAATAGGAAYGAMTAPEGMEVPGMVRGAGTAAGGAAGAALGSRGAEIATELARILDIGQGPGTGASIGRGLLTLGLPIAGAMGGYALADKAIGSTPMGQRLDAAKAEEAGSVAPAPSPEPKEPSRPDDSGDGKTASMLARAVGSETASMPMRALRGGALGGLAGGALGALGAKLRGDKDIKGSAATGALGGAGIGGAAGAFAPMMYKQYGQSLMHDVANAADGPFKSVLPSLLAGGAMGAASGSFGALREGLFGSAEVKEQKDKVLGQFEAQQEIKARQRQTLEPLHQQAFQSAMQDDIVAKAPPELLQSSFDTMRQFAPNIAADPNATRSYLREIASYGTGPNYATLKNLADAETSVSRAGGV